MRMIGEAHSTSHSSRGRTSASPPSTVLAKGRVDDGTESLVVEAVFATVAAERVAVRDSAVAVFIAEGAVERAHARRTREGVEVDVPPAKLLSNATKFYGE